MLLIDPLKPKPTPLGMTCPKCDSEGVKVQTDGLFMCAPYAFDAPDKQRCSDRPTFTYEEGVLVPTT